MDIGLLTGRIIHVLTGVLWVGGMFFVVVFLGPAIGDVGPDGGKVMGALARRKLMVVMPLVAIFSILSGLYLFWRASAGSPDYMSSGTGMTYSVGATAAILAFILGVAVTRPSMMKAMQLSQQMASADASERPSLAAAAEKHRSRGDSAGRIILALLLIAATAMAVGRYIP